MPSDSHYFIVEGEGTLGRLTNVLLFDSNPSRWEANGYKVVNRISCKELIALQRMRGETGNRLEDDELVCLLRHGSLPDPYSKQWCVADDQGRVCDDGGTVLIFPTRNEAFLYLAPYFRDHLIQRHGRIWLAPYYEKRLKVGDPAYASGRGEEIR